jgi:hypothetical protein
MSAAGRLWRRAPAWRVWLVAAIASTGLAAMFPPALPGWLRLHPGTGAVAAHTPVTAGMANAAPAAHFAPLPDAGPAQNAFQMMNTSPDRRGVIPFSGRQIPLPAGAWKDVALARSGGAVPIQHQVLVRIENGHLTGLLQADAPSPISGAAGLLMRPAFCFAMNTIMTGAAPEPAGANPMVHECWILVDLDLTAPKRAALGTALQETLNHVEAMDVKVPDHMLVLFYSRSSELGWMNTMLLLPDQQDVTAAANRRLQAWVKRYAGLLHQAFEGRVPVGETAARDPT